MAKVRWFPASGVSPPKAKGQGGGNLELAKKVFKRSAANSFKEHQGGYRDAAVKLPPATVPVPVPTKSKLRKVVSFLLETIFLW